MTLVKTTLLALMLTAGAAIAGESTPAAASTETVAKPAATESDSAVATKPVKARACDPISGSRIRPSLAEGCRTSIKPMRSFTQEDLQRTGEMDMNEALRKLDPIFR